MIALARPLSFLMSARSARTSARRSGSRCRSSAKPEIACSGLFSSCAMPESRTPIAASRSCRITCCCSELELLAHAALLVDLPRDRLARLAQVVDHLAERVAQVLELARRHRLERQRAQIAGADAIGACARGARATRSQRRRNTTSSASMMSVAIAGDADRPPVDRPRAPPRDRRRDADAHVPARDRESARRGSRAPRPRGSTSPGWPRSARVSSVIVTSAPSANFRWLR